MSHLLKKEVFAQFIDHLKRSHAVIAPVAKEDFTVYREISSADEIDLSENTLYSPKEHYLPKKEELFSYKETIGGKTKADVSSDQKPKVLFGMRMCDVSALRKVDKFYMHDIEDPYHKKRREELLVIALKCDIEGPNCFCSSFEIKDEGYDLFFQKTKDGFLADAGSARGKKMLKSRFFTETSRPVDKTMPKTTKKLELRKINPDAKIFEEYGKECMHCCACNIVCPTCTCFDIHDEPADDLKSGRRVRTWDHCQSWDYTKVAGGHVFRKDSKGRFRHRLQCKFEYMKKEMDEITCTGCGRCISACYKGICDIPEIFALMDD